MHSNVPICIFSHGLPFYWSVLKGLTLPEGNRKWTPEMSSWPLGDLHLTLTETSVRSYDCHRNPGVSCIVTMMTSWQGRASEQTVELLVIWDAMTLMWHWRNVLSWYCCVVEHHVSYWSYCNAINHNQMSFPVTGQIKRRWVAINVPCNIASMNVLPHIGHTAGLSHILMNVLHMSAEH